MSFKKIQSPITSLYSGLSASATSMIILTPKDLDGNILTMAAMGTNPQCTVDPRIKDFEEIIGFQTMTNNGDGTTTLGTLSRNLASSSLATPGTGKQHGASAIVVFSLNPQDTARLAAMENANTWGAIQTFSVSPIVPTPTTPTQAANMAYVDNGVLQGAADASIIVKGIARASASPNVTKGTFTVTIASPAVFSFTTHGLTVNDTVQFTTTGLLPTGISVSTTYFVISAGLTASVFRIAATLGGTVINTSGSQSGVHTLLKTTPVFLGENDVRVERISLLNRDYVVDTGVANAYLIAPSPVIASYVTGQTFSFRAVSANTTTSTINVNGLGVKTIKNSVGGNLVANDILANQIVVVEYDGTDFQMISNSGRGAVGLSGAETLAGLKTFSSIPVLPASDPTTGNEATRKSYVDANIIVFKNGITTRAGSTGSGSQTIAHGLGKIPKKISIRVTNVNGSNGGVVQSIGAYDGITNSVVWSVGRDIGNGVVEATAGNSTTQCVYSGRIQGGSTGNQTAIATFDATNITLTWTLSGSGNANDMNILWEAQG